MLIGSQVRNDKKVEISYPRLDNQINGWIGNYYRDEFKAGKRGDCPVKNRGHPPYKECNASRQSF